MPSKTSKRQRKHKASQSLKSKQAHHQQDALDCLAEQLQEEAGFEQ